MGGHFSSETSLVVCYSGRCSHAFPLRVSTDAARAASAAAMGNAMVATVVGYTTQLTREAGAASLRLHLRFRGPLPGVPGAASSASEGVTTPSCSSLALRAGTRFGFLAAIGALIGTTEGTFLEAVVFGRPNEAFAELMHLEEATLQELYPLGSTVDLRLLRSMPFERFEEAPVPEPSAVASVGSAEAAAEAQPMRSPKAEWLMERLLQLARLLEQQFTPPRAVDGGDGAYEGIGEWLDNEAVQQWLQTAGLRVTQ